MQIKGTPAGATATLASVALATKATGFLRVAALTAVLGATADGDAFFTAFLLPELLYLWCTEGGMTGALVRVFAAHPSLRTRRSILWGASLLGVALAACLAAFAPAVVGLVAPGFPGDTHASAVRQVRFAAMYIPVAMVYFCFQAASNARGEFLAPALGPLAFNLSLFGAALLARGAAAPGDILAKGILVGGLAQLACTVPGAWTSATSEGSEQPWGQALTEAVRLTVPTALLVGLLQLQFLFERSLLSTTVVGSITRFSTAQKLVNLPVGLCAVPLVTALVPYLARCSLHGAGGALRGGVLTGVRTLVWTMVPITVTLASMPLEAMALVFGRGRFGSGDLHLTAELVEVAAPATLTLALSMLLVRAYLADGDSRTPAKIKGVGTVVMLVLDSHLFPLYGERALFLVAMAVHAGEALALYLLLPDPSEGSLRAFLAPWGRVLLPALALHTTCITVLASATSRGGVASMETVLGAVLAGFAGFGAFAWCVGAPSPRALLGELRALRGASPSDEPA